MLVVYPLSLAGDESLEVQFASEVFADGTRSTIAPDAQDAAGLEAFMEHYQRGRVIENVAVERLG